VPLKPGVNQFSVTASATPAADCGDTNLVSVTYGATNAPPAGQVVINEIMYAPAWTRAVCGIV